MRKVVCLIRRNELHTHKADFPTWEIPILNLIHKEQVTELETIETESRVLDPPAEYERLVRRYGLDKETHVPRVAMVYGNPPMGIQQLALAMKEELERQDEQDQAAAAAAAGEPGTEGEPEERRSRKRAS